LLLHWIKTADGFSPVLLEIQDTLKQPPPAVKSMRGAINIGAPCLHCIQSRWLILDAQKGPRFAVPAPTTFLPEPARHVCA